MIKEFTHNEYVVKFLNEFIHDKQVKDSILSFIENSYYRGHTDGYCEGFSNGMDEAERRTLEDSGIEE